MSKRNLRAIPRPKRQEAVPGALAAMRQGSLQRAWASYARGEREEAAAQCRAILTQQPDDAGASSLLGITLAQAGRAEEALALLARAAARTPNDASAHNNHGNVLRDLGRHVAALDCFDRSLALKPSYPEAHYNRGVTLLDLRRYADALESFDRALALNPDSVPAWNNRGTALRGLGRREEALASYDRAIALKRDHAQALNNRGVVLQELKRFEEALASYDRALAVRPADAETLNNRAAVLKELARFEEALASCDRVLALEPDHPDALNTRGAVLHELQRFSDALESFDRALATAPARPEAHSNRGVTLIALNRIDAALASLDRAVALAPRYAKAHRNHGVALHAKKRYRDALASYERALAIDADAETYQNEAAALEQLARFEEAVASYERALALNPGAEFAAGAARHARMNICDWEAFDADVARIAAGIEQNRAVITPFAALSLIDSPDLQRRVAEIWARQRCAPPCALGPIAPREPHDRIRIGYFSADFRNHAVAALTAELFEMHDRSRFEVSAFALGPDVRDELRARVEIAFDRFVSVGARSDREVASLARSLGIDIAVDLGGYTRDARPRIFALRAAPVQVSYLGYLGTMGADFIDYLIADPLIVPPEARHHYTEKIAYLPSYQVNDSRRAVPGAAPTRAELGLPAEGFVFCCFNAHYKINPLTFASWMRILAAVPGSVLFLLGGKPQIESNLRRSAAEQGIAPERLIFGGKLPYGEYLARFRAADLFLDTSPYNAGTTASDALWAGLPVLTFPGATFAARMASSLLQAVGLPELIAADRQTYEEIAARLATDAPRLALYRDKLAGSRQTAVLFDAKACARHLEALYRAMYERHRARLDPEHLQS